MATMLDPDIQRLLDTVFNVPVGTEAPDVAQLRATAEAVPGRLGGEPEAVASITDAFAPGEHELLPVRIYRPAAAELLPLVVYAHGGGWVTGSLDSQDRLCRILANRLRAVLVAVAYRRAPEHVYPAALDDFEAAWRWARSEAKSLGRPIYWAGPRRNWSYELTVTKSGRVFVRYLPRRAAAGDSRSGFLTVGTYPAADAYPNLKKVSTGHGVHSNLLPNDGLLVAPTRLPKNVYLAYPNDGYQVEVYDASTGAARRMALNGLIEQIR